MNRKQLILLVIALVVVGGLGAIAYRKSNKSWDTSGTQLGQKVFKDFPVNKVERIRVKQGTNEMNLAIKGDVWVVEERSAYPANFGNIHEFLRKVQDLKVAQPVKVGASQLPRLELADKGTNLATVVEFKDGKGATLQTVTFGKKHMKEGRNDSPFGGGGGWPDGRYIMVGSDASTVAVVSEPFANVETKPEDWINKDWFKIEKHKSISVTSTNATNNWSISRETETGEWKLANAKKDEQLDPSKSSSVTSALSSPYFTDISTNTAAFDKPIATAKIETFDGFVYDVKVGDKVAPDKDDYLVKVNVTATFPKERTPGKDEKPEDKAKLDKEWKDKNEKLEEKLKAEREFNKWAYIVSKWTIDPLLKGRHELVSEKKEEPKVAETPGAAPKPGDASPAASLLPPELIGGTSSKPGEEPKPAVRPPGPKTAPPSPPAPKSDAPKPTETPKPADDAAAKDEKK